MSVTATKAKSALIIGVPSFDADGAEPRLQDLSFASELTQELAEVLDGLGYVCFRPTGQLRSEDLGSTVFEHLHSYGADAIQIVHVLTHGLGASGGATVYAVGSDGARHRNASIADWLTEAENLPGRPQTLFLLDLCSAGGLARLDWQVRLAEDGARTWVLAASQADRPAYNGRFTQAVINVLRGLAAGELDIDPTRTQVPLEVVARAVRRELNRLVEEADGYRQQVTGTLIDISIDINPPFFRNPAYQPDHPVRELRSQLDPGIAPFLDDLDDGLDARHFVERGAGLGSLTDRDGPLIGCFTGRKAELTRLSPWLNGHEPQHGGLTVVTGSPGVGKSALLGVMVCAAHPRLRDLTEPVWRGVEQPPYRVQGPFAAVHARGRDLASIIASIGRQLELGESSTVPDLVSAIHRLSSPPVIVLDALDEADVGTEVMTELLLPLAEVGQDDAGRYLRLLVGTRRYDEYAPLLRRAGDARRLIDLDRTSRRVLEDDLEAYINKLLIATDMYRDRGGVRGAFAARVARMLADPSEKPPDREWGEFLVAGLYTRYLLTASREPVSAEDADRIGAEVPRTLPEVLDLDLAAQPNDRLLRAVLTALANAYGQGMPASVLSRAASAYDESLPATLPHTQLRTALAAGRFYLRQSTDSNGTTLYRLFHQGLADHLRRSSHDPDSTGQATMLFDRLLQPLGPPKSRDWRAAEPYLVRHAFQHAVATGNIDQVLTDPGFLLAADPVTAHPAPAGYDREKLRLFHSIQAAAQRQADSRDRWASLALSATRAGLADLARRAANPPSQPPLTWQPIWIAGHPEPVPQPADEPKRSRDATEGRDRLDWFAFGGHRDSVTNIAFARVDSWRVMVTAALDGIGVWDLQQRTAIGRFSTGWRETHALACTTILGRPVAVTVSGDRRLRIWDLQKRTKIRTIRTGGIGDAAGSLVCFQTQDSTVAAIGGRNAHLRDLENGTIVGPATLAPDGPVTAMAHMEVRATQVLVTGDIYGIVRVWNLSDVLHMNGARHSGHRGPVNAIVCTTISDHPVVISSGNDGQIILWRLNDRLALDRVAGFRTEFGDKLHIAERLACLVFDGRTILVTEQRASTPEYHGGLILPSWQPGHYISQIAVHDLSDQGRTLGTFEIDPLASAIACAVVEDQPAVIIGGRDPSLRVRLLGSILDRPAYASDQPAAAPAPPDPTVALPVMREVRVTHLDGRETAVVVDSNGEAVARDLATGERRRDPVAGNGQPVRRLEILDMGGRPTVVLDDEDGRSRVWDLTSGVAVRSRFSPPGPVSTVGRPGTATLFADGRLVMFSADRYSVAVHDPADRKRELQPGHDGTVTAMAALELDGHLLGFSGGDDGTVRIWDLDARRLNGTIELTGNVTHIEALPSGYLIVAGGGEVVAFRYGHMPRGDEM